MGILLLQESLDSLPDSRWQVAGLYIRANLGSRVGCVLPVGIRTCDAPESGHKDFLCCIILSRTAGLFFHVLACLAA